MVKPKGTLKVCKRGHEFYKSSDCPVCPVCAKKEKEKNLGDFPDNLGAPALRALAGKNIKSLTQLTKFTEQEILLLHGMGKSGIVKLKQALKDQDKSFKK
jgi:hypothetical protein